MYPEVPAASKLVTAKCKDIDAVTFQILGTSERMTWAQSLQANYTNGIVALHRGKLVYERYFGALAPARPDVALSITKSFTRTLGAMLVADGTLDENSAASRFVPELKDTAFGNATVRQILDMPT